MQLSSAHFSSPIFPFSMAASLSSVTHPRAHLESKFFSRSLAYSSILSPLFRRRHFFKVLQPSTIDGSAHATFVESLPPLKYQFDSREQLGHSDLLISEITLGTMSWGNENSEKEAHDLLCYAFDNGVNILDTSETYPILCKAGNQGKSELYISTWLKNMPRDKVILATNVPGFYIKEGGEPHRVDAKTIQQSVDRSLKRLNTDYIDLLQIQWPDRYVPIFGDRVFNPAYIRQPVPIEEQLSTFQNLISQGKVRYFGVSNETCYGVTQFCNAAQKWNLPKIVSIQNSYNLLDRMRFEVNLAEACHPYHCNLGLLAYAPLAGGVLSGKYLNLKDPSAQKGRMNVYFPKDLKMFNKSIAGKAVSEYAAVAKKYNLSLVQLALAFVRDRWFVTSTVIGAMSRKQLHENLSVYELYYLLDEEMEKDITDVYQRYRDPLYF